MEWESSEREGVPSHTRLSITCCESENGSEGIFELLIRSKKAAKVGWMVERGGERVPPSTAWMAGRFLRYLSTKDSPLAESVSLKPQRADQSPLP